MGKILALLGIVGVPLVLSLVGGKKEPTLPGGGGAVLQPATTGPTIT